MFNYCMTVSYDGRNYFGWQRHGSKPTIQYAIEQAMHKVLGEEITIKGAGRTDRGAHAHGQVASFELPFEMEPKEIKHKLNNVLATDIRAVEVHSAPDDFHARDSAVGKHYRYLIWNDKSVPKDLEGRVWHSKKPLDVEPMIKACSVFVGEHDFVSFATKPNFKQKLTTRKVVKAVMSHDNQMITFDIWADGFLYKMVRNIVRSIAKVGEGRYTHEDLCRIIEAKDRKSAPGTAPASGLFLERVFYSQEEFDKDSK